MGLTDLLKLKDIDANILEGLREIPQDCAWILQRQPHRASFYGRNRVFLEVGR